MTTLELLTQGAAIAAGAVYAELPDDVIDYVKGSYAFLQSTAPDGYAEEVFRLPPSATRNQRSLQDALQSDKRGWHPAAARQDSGDGKRSGPDAGVSGQAPALAENGHLTQAGHDPLMEASLAGATLVSKGRLVGDTAQAADSVQRDAARWHWMAEYIVGTRTDLDDGIVASETVNDLRKLVDADRAARKQGEKQ